MTVHERAERVSKQSGQASPAFTPGPWTADPEFDYQSVLGPDGVQVADCSITVNPRYGKRTNEINEANARLVAAAPDLLEALKMARDCIAYCRRAHKDAQSGEGIPVELFIDAAIAKATMTAPQLAQSGGLS